jgi:hypothetical protein
MTANISREVRELRAALADRRGDRAAEPRVTAALLAHLVVSSRELLQSLLPTLICGPMISWFTDPKTNAINRVVSVESLVRYGITACRDTISFGEFSEGAAVSAQLPEPYNN